MIFLRKDGWQISLGQDSWGILRGGGWRVNYQIRSHPQAKIWTGETQFSGIGIHLPACWVILLTIVCD